MIEGQTTTGEYVPLEVYQKELREMQREVNYLRKRVATLNDIIVDLQNHTTSSVEYLQDAIDDMQMDLDLR